MIAESRHIEQDRANTARSLQTVPSRRPVGHCPTDRGDSSLQHCLYLFCAGGHRGYSLHTFLLCGYGAVDLFDDRTGRYGGIAGDEHEFGRQNLLSA
jgi:hypothetical protein